MRVSDLRKMLRGMHSEAVINLENKNLDDKHLGAIIDFARVTNHPKGIILNGNNFSTDGLATFIEFIASTNSRIFSSVALNRVNISNDLLVKLLNAGIEKKFYVFNEGIQDGLQSREIIQSGKGEFTQFFLKKDAISLDDCLDRRFFHKSR